MGIRSVDSNEYFTHLPLNTPKIVFLHGTLRRFTRESCLFIFYLLFFLLIINYFFLPGPFGGSFFFSPAPITAPPPITTISATVSPSPFPWTNVLSKLLGSIPRIPPCAFLSPFAENSRYAYFHSSKNVRSVLPSLSLPPFE